ncbi:MAG: hypothetical protein NTY88_05545 [Bacteroidetes bacterium]|nr:hypothetical protein [Bacteroidota bacterium]
MKTVKLFRRGLMVLLFSVAMLHIGCNTKTIEDRYIYDIQTKEIYQSASQKQTLKTTTQFVSIAYSDLNNSSITNDQLNKLDIAYQSLGDKKIIEDMIIKTFLQQANSLIPSNTVMRSDISSFVQNTYLRFYNRKPNEFEAWKVKDMIEKNADITPKMVYYTLMTSDEYRYY